MAFIDTLSIMFINTSGEKFINSLELIAKESDGYVSDYLPSVCKKIYKKNFNGIFNYLYYNRKSSLKQFFVEAIAFEIEDYQNRDDLTKYFNKQMDNNNFNSNKRKYFQEIIKKVNEQIKKDK